MHSDVIVPSIDVYDALAYVVPLERAVNKLPGSRYGAEYLYLRLLAATIHAQYLLGYASGYKFGNADGRFHEFWDAKDRFLRFDPNERG